MLYKGSLSYHGNNVLMKPIPVYILGKQTPIKSVGFEEQSEQPIPRQKASVLQTKDVQPLLPSSPAFSEPPVAVVAFENPWRRS